MVNLPLSAGSRSRAHAPASGANGTGWWGKTPGILRGRCGPGTTMRDGVRVPGGLAIAGESGNQIDRLMGLGSGVRYESRFPGKCSRCGHVDHSYHRGAVGDQDLLRGMNRQDALVEYDQASLPRRRKPAVPSAPAATAVLAVRLTVSRSPGSAPRGRNSPGGRRAATSQGPRHQGRSRIRRRARSSRRPAGAPGLPRDRH